MNALLVQHESSHAVGLEVAELTAELVRSVMIPLVVLQVQLHTGVYI